MVGLNGRPCLICDDPGHNAEECPHGTDFDPEPPNNGVPKRFPQDGDQLYDRRRIGRR